MLRRPSSLLSPMGPVEPGMGRSERARKIVQQIGKTSGQCRRPRDQNIVMPAPSMKGKNSRSSGSKPSFRPVARHRVSHLAAGGEAYAQMALGGRRRRTEFQRQSGDGAANTPRGAQEIGTVFQAIHDG